MSENHLEWGRLFQSRTALSITGYLAIPGPLYPKSKKCLLPRNYADNQCAHDFRTTENQRATLENKHLSPKTPREIQEFIQYNLNRLSSACLISWKCSVPWAACLYREIRNTLHEITRQRRLELVKVCFSLRNLAPILSYCAHDETCGKNTLIITQIIKSTKENWNWEHFLNIFFYFLSGFYILHKFSHSSQRMLSFEIEWIL